MGLQARQMPPSVFGPVVFACDSAWAMPLATALRSLAESNHRNWPLDVTVLCEGFSEATREQVVTSLPPGSARIRWVPVDLSDFGGYSSADYTSRTIYARLLIPKVFSKSVLRVLYLDADILVLDELGPLWNIALDGAVVGAVLDDLDSEIKKRRPIGQELPPVRRYFNSGVLLIDLDRWRKEEVSERAVEYLRGHPTSPFPDQDALNWVCDGKWKSLDGRWNSQLTRFNGKDFVETRISVSTGETRPAIAHFVTAFKPWKVWTLSVNAPLYDSFRSRTSFRRSRWQRLCDWLLVAGYRIKRPLARHLGASLR